MKKLFLPAIVIVVTILVISALGGGITKSGMEWYRTLRLPDFTPPGWVISSAWSLIYLLTGIAAWRVWTSSHALPKRALAKVAVANVILNVGWSAAFFGLHLLWVSIFVCVLLGVTVAVAIGLLWKRDKLSAGLLMPYLGWVCFATVLNISIALLN